jgi:hypothetical protein
MILWSEDSSTSVTASRQRTRYFIEDAVARSPVCTVGLFSVEVVIRAAIIFVDMVTFGKYGLDCVGQAVGEFFRNLWSYSSLGVIERVSRTGTNPRP